MAKATNLVIVESPSKAKTIGKYLGPDYTVKASMGHLRDLPKSTMGVDLEHDFTPKYIPVTGKEDLIRDLKKASAQAQTVFLATDPDREGEAISWHLKELLQLPDSKACRVTFNEITQKVVRDSIASVGDAMDAYVENFIKENYNTPLGPCVFRLLCGTLPYPLMTKQIERIFADAPPVFMNDFFVWEFVAACEANERILNK